MPQIGDIYKIPYNPYTVLILEIYYADEKRVETRCLYNDGYSEEMAWYRYNTTQITFHMEDFTERYNKIGHVDISELTKL